MLWSSSWKYTSSGSPWLPQETKQKALGSSWTLRSEPEPKLGALDETRPSQRPPVAPLHGLGINTGGPFSRASHTPRSTQRHMSMRVSWPSLEIERADVEAMEWWFSEMESQLAVAVPDARCRYPWFQQYPDLREVEKELTSSFTFDDFKQGWNFVDFSNYSSWYEEQVRRSSRAEAEPSWPASLETDPASHPRAPQGQSRDSRPCSQLSRSLRTDPKDSRRSSESRTSLGYSIASSALSFALPRTSSLTPRQCAQTGPTLANRVSSTGLRQTAQGQCHSAR
eukprot:s567_g16.t1